MHYLSFPFFFRFKQSFLTAKASCNVLLKSLSLVFFLLLVSPSRAQTPDWSFIKGYGNLPFYPTYGSQGMAGVDNTPGARYSPVSWEMNGRFYLFGGYGNGISGEGLLNDLWEFDPATGNWRWLKGSMAANEMGSYGTQGLASSGNHPGARQEAVSWTYNGKLYLFGGLGYANGIFQSKLNDLWEYNPADNTWRWLKGSQTLDQPGVYGTQGLAAAGNTPGARQGAASWQHNGKFYLFGGEAATSTAYYNDLWEYDPAANTWTWIKGSTSLNQGGSYGTPGLANAGNTPGGRFFAQAWVHNGQLYLFGGVGNGAGSTGNLNDLWAFDPATQNWTWLKGSNAAGETGVYGTQGTAEAANTPGARANTMGWTQDGKLYLFGGEEEYYYGKRKFDDLWEFDPASGNWRWLKGSKLLDQQRITGTQGTADGANSPGGRAKAVGWQLHGRFYLFGGHAVVGAVDVKLNDVWAFDPVANNWTWLEGSNTLEQLGVYGTKGLAAAANTPGARVAMVNWQVAGKLYLFGGLGATDDHVGLLNDLWEYDVATKKWRWLTGSDTIYQKGSYGSKGVAAAGNTPGARYFPSAWESGGKLYLFGGQGVDKAGTTGGLNDLWEYDPAAHTWRWVSGSDLVNGMGSYGTISVAAEGNTPGARYASVSWQNNGRLYLFGGSGNTASAAGSLNDLWEFNLTTGLWRWIKGSDQVEQAGMYGLREVAETGNTPAGKVGAVGWQLHDKLYLFGGLGSPGLSRTNDLWEFDLVTHNWRWLAGSQVPEQVGTYGTPGLADANNMPGARQTSFTWTGSNKLYLFGGNGNGAAGSGSGYLNDLWEYDISTKNWTWLKGSDAVNQPGTYQTQELADPGNTPGGRQAGASWFRNGQLLLFGGQGYGVNGDADVRADLWGMQLEAPNSPPSNISLSNNTLNENVAANSTVGTFSTTDADAGDLHSYSLVAGAGDADNAAFSLSGNALRLSGSPDFETKSSYSIRVRSDDGKIDGSFEKAFTVTINDLDEVPPAAPAAPDLADASDSGKSNTDNITNITRPTFSGMAEDGAVVRLFATFNSMTTQLGTATAAGGHWQITPPAPLVPGSYAITATATDAAGNTSTAGLPLSLVIDRTLPASPSSPDLLSTSDTGGSNSDDYTADTTPAFSGTAEAGAQVSLYRGGSLVGSTVAADGTWLITSNELPSGTFVFTASATDAAGNTSAVSPSLSITIDADAPPAPQILALADDTGVSGSDKITTDQSITLHGTAYPQTTLSLYLNGDLVGTIVVPGSAMWSIAIPGMLLPGTHTCTAEVRDLAGNVSPLSTAFPFTIDRTAPTVSVITQPAAKTYVAGEQLAFTFNLSEAVTVSGSPGLGIRVGGSTRTAAYVSGSGTADLLFSYTVQPGDVDADGVTVSSISLNGGSIHDLAGNFAALTLPAGATSGVLVDAVIPAVTAVAVPAAASYRSGQHLDLTVHFSENVEVNTAGGTPALAIQVGSTLRNASYLGGSGTAALLFRYPVQAGDLDADGIALQALAANGATLQDAAGNNAALTLNAVASTAGVLVDAVAPAFVQVNLPAYGTYKTGDNLDFQVDFDEPVLLSGTDSKLLLTIGSVVKQASAVSASGAGILYRYTVQAGDADGISIEALVLNTSTLRDAAGNDAQLAFAPVAVAGILVDAEAPVIASVAVPAAGSYKAGSHLDFALAFSEPLAVTGVPSLGLTLGSSAKAAAYLGGTGTNTLIFRYTVQPGDEDADGIGVNALSLNGGRLQDAAGNGAVLALNGLASTAGVLVDTRAPQVLSVDLPADKTYVNNEDLDFRVTFDEAVTVAGTPGLLLGMETGGARQAGYVSGSSTTTLLFRYTVENGVRDDNGLALGTSLELNGGTLADAAGNAASLALAGLGSTAGILVDGTAPRVLSVQVPAAKTYVAGETLDFALHYSKALTVSGGTPSLDLSIGSQEVSAVYQSGSGTSTLRFRYTVREGEQDTDGIELGTSLAANGAALLDASGNQALLTLPPVAGTAQVLVDAVAPVLTQVSLASGNADASQAKTGDVVTLRFTASEALQPPVVTLAGQPAAVTAISPSQYAASYTLTGTEAEGPVSFAISYRDLVNNPGAPLSATTDNSSVLFDKTAPWLEITSQAPGLTNAPYQVTFTFTEAVRNFDMGDISVVNGAVSGFAAHSGNSYAALITPAADGQVQVAVAAGAARDAAGNASLAASPLVSLHDATRPVVTLATSAPQLTNAPYAVSFTFSEAVTGFEASDIALSNATVSGFTALSNTAYTAFISPQSLGTVSVGVAADAVQDAAGNGNAAPAVLTRSFDNAAPGGYALAFQQAQIHLGNQRSVALRVRGAEAGESFFYTISSTGGGTPLTGMAPAPAAAFDLTGIDVSSLADGQLTASFYQQDAAGNQGLAVAATASKVTRDIVAFSPVAPVQVPIRTAFAQLPLPATVEVVYSDNTRQHLAVSWAAGSYNGLAPGSYELAGTFTLAANTTNLGDLQASIGVSVEPNQAPTAIALSNASFSPALVARDEAGKQPQAIGQFSTTDADDPADNQPASQHVYALMPGSGDTHNHLFEIVGQDLFLKSNKGLSGQTRFSIRVRSTDPYQNTFEQTFTLSKGFYEKSIADLKIVNTFTPNNDGTNDTWTIPELRFYNQVEIEVYDRSGYRLFYTTDPEKGWDGKNQKGQLLKGPFLYVVKVKDINLVKRGVVTILKK